jgi:hypothetical protein
MEDPNKLASLDNLKEETEKMWKLIQETLAFYDHIACPCAFPRFRQYTAIDCVNFRGSFYMSETEAFLHYCQPYFDVQEIDKGDENYRAIYTCKKCKSIYEFGWTDFSIRVSRTYLKIEDIKAVQIGLAGIRPIPFYLGLFGHMLPARDQFQKVELADFITYIRGISDQTNQAVGHHDLSTV